MRFALILALLPTLLPVPALACVTPEDAQRGVLFKRADGLAGRLVVAGDETQIHYDTGREGPTDDRKARYGVFETERVFQATMGIVVGSAIPVETWKFSPRPGSVVAGGSWSGRLKGLRDEVGYGDYMREYHSYARWRSRATYAFLAEEVVTISTCKYTVIPVEASFDGDVRQSQRWLYFKDLGFAIETIRDGKKNGIATMEPEPRGLPD